LQVQKVTLDRDPAVTKNYRSGVDSNKIELVEIMKPHVLILHLADVHAIRQYRTLRPAIWCGPQRPSRRAEGSI